MSRSSTVSVFEKMWVATGSLILSIKIKIRTIFQYGSVLSSPKNRNHFSDKHHSMMVKLYVLWKLGLKNTWLQIFQYNQLFDRRCNHSRYKNFQLIRWIHPL